jgi:large subunit ribosomal protein L4
MQVKYADTGGAIELSDEVFGGAYNAGLVHQAVVAFQEAGRAGTKAQKSRAEVSGGGRKPWRQKGTGQARAGTTRSPLWRKGGVTFAARPRDFGQKLNKKMLRAAMRSIFSELIRQDRLILVESVELEAAKTRELQIKLKALAPGSVLIVADKVDEKLRLAARNLPHVDVAVVSGLDPVRPLRFDKVVATGAAVRQIEGWLA